MIYRFSSSTMLIPVNPNQWVQSPSRWTAACWLPLSLYMALAAALVTILCSYLFFPFSLCPHFSFLFFYAGAMSLEEYQLHLKTIGNKGDY